MFDFIKQIWWIHRYNYFRIWRLFGIAENHSEIIPKHRELFWKIENQFETQVIIPKFRALLRNIGNFSELSKISPNIRNHTKTLRINSYTGNHSKRTVVILKRRESRRTGNVENQSKCRESLRNVGSHSATSTINP